MGISIDFGNQDVHFSLPVLSVVPQQLYFRHHGTDASAFFRLDWIMDEHIEDVSLPERRWRDVDNQALKSV
jgi:hypothetical protein